MKSILNYVDGQSVRGKREFADANPTDGSKADSSIRSELTPLELVS